MGYWDAFEQVLKGVNLGEVFEAIHADWYLGLFDPSVATGLIKQSDLTGYRTESVYIRKSKHTPSTKEAVREMMPALFYLLMEEENPAVRIVMGHYIFVHIPTYLGVNG